MSTNLCNRRGRGTDRASAEAVGTILALATLLVFAGLTIPALDVITEAATIGQQRHLEFHAQRLSGELQTVDQLVRSSASPGPIGRSVDLPDRVGNEPYLVSIRSKPEGEQIIIFRSASGTVTARARFIADTPVENTTVSGGNLRIIRENGSREIVVRHVGGR